ncbi:hypothetical protein KA005_42875 [bacterium]|nr:hypothetical protein [bacterium]
MMEVQNLPKEEKAISAISFEKLANAIVGFSMTDDEAVDLAYNLKAEIDEKTKLLDKYKTLFKETLDAGEQLEGTEGYVLLTEKASVSVEPGKLYDALKDAEFPVPFYDLISVKIADSRKVLGTSIFSKIEKRGVPVIAVTIGKRK